MRRNRALPCLTVALGLLLSLSSAAAQEQFRAGQQGVDKPQEKVPTSYPSAPDINVSQWLGQEVDLMERPGPLIILDLWATWCGPCIKAMPHLSEVGKKHRDRVKIVAMTEEAPEVVTDFIKKNPKLFTFPVALDIKGKTFARYKKAFGFRGIPVTFLIRNGEVLWHGHPSAMDKPLEAILDGRWTPASSFMAKKIRRVASAYEKAMLSKAPTTAETEAMVDVLIEGGAHDPMILNNVSWTLLTEVTPQRRPLADALRLAKAANKHTRGQSHHVRDTLALALYLTGDITGALMHQSKAVEMCQAKPGTNCKEIIKALARYKADVRRP